MRRRAGWSMRLEPERHRSPTVSLTPLIDVVFILLVFFMLATRFSHWKDLPVDVRPADNSRQADDHKNWLTLTVTADGRVRWGDATLTRTELAERLTGSRRPVIVSGAPDASLQAALATLDTVRGAGIKTVRLELMP